MDATPATTQLARGLGLDKSTASRLVTTLQKRSSSPQDGEATAPTVEATQNDALEPGAQVSAEPAQ